MNSPQKIKRTPINNLAILFAASLLLQGCATYRGLKGVAATDLSELHLNMQRSEVELILGKPLKIQPIEQGTIAYYSYNRGYIPPSEEEDYSPLWTVPLGLFVDVGTLGMFGYAINKTEDVCQRGLLVAFYNKSGALRLAKENIYNDVQLSWALSGKSEAHCRHVLTHPRPSLLSYELKTTTWPFELSKLALSPVESSTELTTWKKSNLEGFLLNNLASSGTKQNVIEKLSKPKKWENPPGILQGILEQANILVYSVSPDTDGVIKVAPALLPHTLQEEIDTYLFLRFDASEQFKHYTFLEISFSKCEPNFWSFNSGEELYISALCGRWLKNLKVAQYFAMINKPTEAYLSIEAGFISMQQFLASNLTYANQKYDAVYLSKRIETLNKEMVNQSLALIKEYPEIANVAKQQFSQANFKKMSAEYDAKAKEKFQVRLNIYKNLANPVEYKEAEKAWAEYFDVSLE